MLPDKKIVGGKYRKIRPSKKKRAELLKMHEAMFKKPENLNADEKEKRERDSDSRKYGAD